MKRLLKVSSFDENSPIDCETDGSIHFVMKNSEGHCYM